LQTLFLDMNRLLPSNGTPTPARCSESEQQKDGSPTCACTRETCGCSTHPNTPAEWIASMRAGLARIFQSPVLARALKESAAASGRKCGELLARYDRESCSWKTPQLSLLGGSEPFSATWPPWGMMQGGSCWGLPPLVPRTCVLGGGALQDVPTPKAAASGPDYARMNREGSGGHDLATWTALWPTPNATDGKRGPNKPNGRRGLKLTDCDMSRGPMWPTPTCGMAKTAGGCSQEYIDRRNQQGKNDLAEKAVDGSVGGGTLNPTWVEYLMGWPLGWTGLSVSATGRSRSKRRRRTSS